jgi:branched-chain amino acid transport system substrate-binding protein
MTPRVFSRMAIGLCVLLLLPASPSLPPAQAAGLPIVVGLVADTSGSAGVYGRSIRNGATLAVALINKRGGINHHRLILDVRDGATSEPRVVQLYRKMIYRDRVLALLGPTLSSEAKVADPIAQAARVPVIATSNTAPGITAMGSYIFRMSLGEAEVIPLAIETARKHLHFTRVAILYGKDNAVTAANGDIFTAEARKEGLDIADTETFATGDTDFSTQLTRIKDAHPDVILVGALVAEAVRILTQARHLGIPTSVHIIGGNGFNSPALIQQAGVASEGAISGTAWFAGSTRPLNRAFLAQYRSRFGSAPDQFAAQAFDGLNILAAGIARARTTTDRAALRRALMRIKNVPVVTGADGRFTFTATRDAGETGTVQIVRNGAFVVYR